MSAATEAATTTTSRTKEGIPTWSGEASSFVQYEEAALLWEQSLTWEKRYTAGPKLVQELTGAAKRFVAGQAAGWVAYRGGVAKLMNHLRQALGKPRVNEVTDLLATYFKGTRRRNGESMNEFITRKNEAYMRASQAMKRVQPFYEAGGARTSTSTWTSGRRDSMDSTSSWHWGRQWTPAAESEEGRGGTADEETTNDGSTTATEGREATQHAAWHAWRPSYGNSYGGWNWSSSWYGSGGDWDWSAASSYAETEASGSSSGELLPAFIQGWYLLMDSNLDHNERNLVVTALNGNFSPQHVGQELRNQFPEGETRRRDSRKYQSYIGEANDPPDEDYEENQATTMEELIAEGLSEEGIALMADAEGQAQEALAALFEARRTLKEARHKQKVVKQNRKYFHGNGGQAKGSGTSSARPRDDSNLDCLRCGQRGHRAANCPHKPVGAAAQVDQASSSGSYEQAPFVCLAEMTTNTSGEQGTSTYGFDFAGYAHSAFEANTSEQLLTTQEAVRKGMCVIDGGATQTVGSLAALEAVMDQNRRKHGATKIKAIDSVNPPTFSFGNSTENRCMSTAKLEVSANGLPGEISIHTLDQGQSPILLSVEALRRLGAVIDFRDDLAVFRALDDKRVLRLTRGQSGHQLLSLTEDWMSRADTAKCAIPGLATYLQH